MDIWNAAPIMWSKAGNNELSRRIYRVLQRWLPYADQQFQAWDIRPNCGHFFGGAYWYGFDTAFTASVYALLAKLGEYDEQATGMAREAVKRRAIQAIRYLGFTHDSGPDDCVRAEGPNRFCSLQKWGGQGQQFFPASQTGRTVASLGIASWLLWDELDDETRLLVQSVTESYANRWSAEEPRNGVYVDTQCEENAWTAAGIAAGVALYPDHPRHGEWTEAFANWCLNSMTTPADRLAYKHIRTVTFHPDYTAENHGFLHPGYICAGINFRAIHAVLALMGGRSIMSCALHNNMLIYERTVKLWTQFDGLAIPLQGQDWWYNRQHERQLTHAMLNILHRDRDAASLERASLSSIEAIQNSNTLGCLLEEDGERCRITGLQTAKDMEHSSAHDLVVSCLLHMFGGAGVEPSDSKEMSKRLCGVYSYPYGGAVIHRTETSFTSFSWRNRIMALTLPGNGVWTITPDVASYTGTVQLAREDGCLNSVTDNLNFIVESDRSRMMHYDDGFGAVASVIRGHGKLRQHVAFVSLPGGNTLYAEQFHALQPCLALRIDTGCIGIRNEHYAAAPKLAPGRRTLYFPDWEERFYGFYGKGPDRIETFPASAYVNVDNQIGYVLYGSQGIRYVNQHEYPKWKGVEDLLVLNHRGEQELRHGQVLPPFAMLSLPNQTRAHTAASAKLARMLACDSPGTVCVMYGDEMVYVNFNDSKQRVCARMPITQPTLQLFPGNNRVEHGVYTWSGEWPAFQSGIIQRRLTVTVQAGITDRFRELAFDMICLPDRLIIVNGADQDVCLSIRAGRAQFSGHELRIPQGSTEVFSL